MKMIEILKTSSLFSAMTEEDITLLLRCLAPIRKKYKKEAYILRQNEASTQIGILLSGSVLVIKEDFWGERTIVSKIEVGGIFAEAFASTSGTPLEVSIQAQSQSSEETEVLFLDFQRILNTCTNACTFHAALIENLLSVLAQKNIMLTRKIELLSKKTTREKLLAYLSAESIRQKKATFTIPFNRQELADYLSVDRSAMSTELSKLRQEEVISYQKNQLSLLKHEIIH